MKARDSQRAQWSAVLILAGVILVSISCSKKTIAPPPTQEELVASLHQTGSASSQVYDPRIRWDTSFTDLSSFYPDTGDVEFLPMGFRYDIGDSGRNLAISIKENATFVGAEADSAVVLDKHEYGGTVALYARPGTSSPRDFLKQVDITWNATSIYWKPTTSQGQGFGGWNNFEYSNMRAEVTRENVPPITVNNITYFIYDSSRTYQVSPNPMSTYRFLDAPHGHPGDSVVITVATTSDSLIGFIQIGEPGSPQKSPMEFIGSGQYKGGFRIPSSTPTGVWRHIGFELIHRRTLESFQSNTIALELHSISFPIWNR